MGTKAWSGPGSGTLQDVPANCILVVFAVVNIIQRIFFYRRSSERHILICASKLGRQQFHCKCGWRFGVANQNSHSFEVPFPTCIVDRILLLHTGLARKELPPSFVFSHGKSSTDSLRLVGASDSV